MNALDRLSEMLMRTGEEKLKKANEIKTDWMANLQLSDKQFGLNMLEKQLSQQSKDKRMFGTAKYQQSVLDSDRFYNIVRTNQYKEDLMKTNYATAKKEGYRGTYEDFVENESNKALFGWNQAAADQATRRQYAQLGIDAGGNVSLGSGPYGYAGAARSGNPLDVIGGAVGSYSVDDYGNLDNPFDNTRINTQVDQFGRTWARKENFGAEEAKRALEEQIASGDFRPNYINFDPEVMAVKATLPSHLQNVTSGIISELENLTVLDTNVSEAEYSNRVANAGKEIAAYRNVLLQQGVDPETVNRIVGRFYEKINGAFNGRAANIKNLEYANNAGINVGVPFDEKFRVFKNGKWVTSDEYEPSNTASGTETFLNTLENPLYGGLKVEKRMFSSLSNAFNQVFGGTDLFDDLSEQEKRTFFDTEGNITDAGYIHIADAIASGQVPDGFKPLFSEKLKEKAKKIDAGKHVLLATEKQKREYANAASAYLKIIKKAERGERLSPEDIKSLQYYGGEVDRTARYGFLEKAARGIGEAVSDIAHPFSGEFEFGEGKIGELINGNVLEMLENPNLPPKEKQALYNTVLDKISSKIQADVTMSPEEKRNTLARIEQVIKAYAGSRAQAAGY